MKTPTCMSCGQPITTWTPSGYSTTWIHLDGLTECMPRYAHPNFQDQVETSWVKTNLAQVLADLHHELLDTWD